MLTLKQLRAFSVCAQTLSFTIAAQRLNLSQSAVSLLIRELESTLGLSLFERSRRLALTDSGVRFAAQTARVLTDLDMAVANVKGVHESRQGILRVGVGHLLAATLFAEAAARFRDRHPGIQVQIVDCLVEQLPQKVLDGELDFGIGSLRPPDRNSELRIELLFQDTMHVGLPSAPAGPVLPVCWRALEDEPLIVVNAGNEVWATVSATLAGARMRFNVAHQVSLYSTGLALARHGFGCLLLPGFCAGRAELEGLEIRPLIEPIIPWNVSMVYRRAAPPGPVASELLGILKAMPGEKAAAGRRAGVGSKAGRAGKIGADEKRTTGRSPGAGRKQSPRTVPSTTARRR